MKSLSRGIYIIYHRPSCQRFLHRDKGIAEVDFSFVAKNQCFSKGRVLELGFNNYSSKLQSEDDISELHFKTYLFST